MMFRLPDVSWQQKKCLELGIEYIAPLPPCKPVQFEPLTKPEDIFQIKPDGNCFYRAISYIISGDEDVGFMIIRKSVCDLLKIALFKIETIPNIMKIKEI